MRTLTGEGNPDMPDLLGGSFGGDVGPSGRRSALAIIAAARGEVTRRDSISRGGSTGAGGAVGPGGGRPRPDPTPPIAER